VKDQQVGVNSAEFKRGGGGPGSKALGQIDVYEELCVDGDESAGDAKLADKGMVTNELT
jgi:hypothetical protein